MKKKYFVCWFIIDGLKKRLTMKEFDSRKDAESFAEERLSGCVYKIRQHDKDD